MGTSLCPQNLPRTCPLGNAGHRQKSPSWTCMTAGRLRRATRTRDDLYKERLKLQRVCKTPEGVRVSLSFFMHTPFLEKTVEPEVKTKSLTHPEANELFLLPLQTSRAHSPPHSESAKWVWHLSDAQKLAACPVYSPRTITLPRTNTCMVNLTAIACKKRKSTPTLYITATGHVSVRFLRVRVFCYLLLFSCKWCFL